MSDNLKNIKWYDAQQLGIGGKGWKDTESFYHRLPARAKKTVRKIIWDLSKQTAGMYLKFSSDSKTIAAKWTLTNKELEMWHMPSTGVSGLDLYIYDRNKWRQIGISKVLQFPGNQQILAGEISCNGHQKNYILYLPLYNGIKSLKIGIDQSSQISKCKEIYSSLKPIVFYGTSITQGACASRPGMAFTNILQRKLNYPVINLGFSGNCKLEPELADLIGEIDSAAYVISPVPNVDSNEINERFYPFILKLRQLRPISAIIICECASYPQTIYSNSKNILADNNVLKKWYKKLLSLNFKNIYYVERNAVAARNGEDYVDLLHPSDVGMIHIAKGLTPVLQKIIKSCLKKEKKC